MDVSVTHSVVRLPFRQDTDRHVRVRRNRCADRLELETALVHLGTVDGRIGTSARGARVVLAELRAARIPIAGVRLVDGSGLSSLDRITAEALVGVIRAGLENPRIRDAFVGSLAVAGQNGTLRSRLPSRRSSDPNRDRPPC